MQTRILARAGRLALAFLTSLGVVLAQPALAQNTAPTVGLSVNETVSGGAHSVDLSATASDADGSVAKVEFFTVAAAPRARSASPSTLRPRSA